MSADEQAVLDGVGVRVIEVGEQERFDQLLIEQHYLHNAELVGARLCYVAEYAGQWLALLSWSAPAYRLKGREAGVGWTEAQRRRRLRLVVNNSRFLILDGAHYPNLASRVMKLCVGRLSVDWEQRWGHPLLLAESFVDVQVFRGTCYKVSGWLEMGLTQGYGRTRADFYLKHDRPKQLWVRELCAGARELLKARVLPPKYAAVEEYTSPICEARPEELGEARRFFDQVPDWRKKIGDFCCAGLIALVDCASLCGVQRGQRDLAAFARTLTPAQLRALGFLRKKGHPRCLRPPAETTFYRLLTGVDSNALQQALQAWQEQRLGKRASDDDVVALDGKKLLSSQGVEVASAYAVKSGRWLGSQIVEKKSNEIPAAQELLRQIPLEGQKVTLDALHTQQETARIIVQERGADYLLSVKGNQPGVAQTLARQCASRRAFPPSTSGGLGAAV